LGYSKIVGFCEHDDEPVRSIYIYIYILVYSLLIQYSLRENDAT